ncbi:IS3 family transposase [Thalassolituus oleivorans]|uniref:IS3 family transposase n=1 Tax=Thalassolituus oleivorans TaxID=187493 RepID=UPI003C6F6826
MWPLQSRPSKCTDNAHMESFFHTLKAELILGANFQSGEDLKYAFGRYINESYNRTRLHSWIGYCSPMEYERMAALKFICPFYRGKIIVH